MNTKKNLDADWADAMQTLQSLRAVIVKQRKNWRQTIDKVKKGSSFAEVANIDTAEKHFFDYIVKLHKESEVLEHMINRIENGMKKSRVHYHVRRRQGEKSDTEE